MKALIFNKNNELKLVNDYEKPIPDDVFELMSDISISRPSRLTDIFDFFF